MGIAQHAEPHGLFEDEIDRQIYTELQLPGATVSSTAGKARVARATVISRLFRMRRKTGARSNTELFAIGPQIDSHASASSAKATPTLTRRQHDVANDLVGGLTNDEIAANRGISPSAAKSHVSALLRKYGVVKRRQLAALLAKDGFPKHREIPVANRRVRALPVAPEPVSLERDPEVCCEVLAKLFEKERDLQIFQLVAIGMDAAKVGQIVGLSKNSVDQELSRMARRVNARTVMEMLCIGVAAGAEVPGLTPPTTGHVTQAEARVVEQLRHGASNVESAGSLGLSPATVYRHIQNLSDRFGAHDRNHLMVLLASADFGEVLRPPIAGDAGSLSKSGDSSGRSQEGTSFPPGLTL